MTSMLCQKEKKFYFLKLLKQIKLLNHWHVEHSESTAFKKEENDNCNLICEEIEKREERIKYKCMAYFVQWTPSQQQIICVRRMLWDFTKQYLCKWLPSRYGLHTKLLKQAVVIIQMNIS